MLIDQSCIFKYFEKKCWKTIFSEFFFAILNICGYFFPIFKNLSEQFCVIVCFNLKKYFSTFIVE
jgi:hypothetical protein